MWWGGSSAGVTHLLIRHGCRLIRQWHVHVTSVVPWTYTLRPHKPSRQAIQPQILGAMQCVRRWQKADMGDDEADNAMADAEMHVLYGVRLEHMG
jgi:hypothetical protein